MTLRFPCCAGETLGAMNLHNLIKVMQLESAPGFEPNNLSLGLILLIIMLDLTSNHFLLDV